MTIIKNAVELLRENKVGSVLTNELLANHSTWKIGGPADIVVVPVNSQGISDTMRIANELSLPVVIIGSGSNLLFDDAGVRGIVIKIDAGLSHFEIKGNNLKAGAGVWVPCLARSAGKAGLTGLEHIVGIPGTFGGLLFMNGGSQRKSISELVKTVLVMDRNGEQHKLSLRECKFAYRKSIFQENNLIILEAELTCLSGEPATIRREMLTILKSRSKKFPRKLPNCGSVFVSDPAMYESFGSPGKVIEDCNLKGSAVGDALVSPLHANFIVNTDKATSKQIIMLINNIRQKVYARTKSWLRCEVQYVYSEGLIIPLHEVFK